jgi:hypothetical protein
LPASKGDISGNARGGDVASSPVKEGPLSMALSPVEWIEVIEGDFIRLGLAVCSNLEYSAANSLCFSVACACSLSISRIHSGRLVVRWEKLVTASMDCGMLVVVSKERTVSVFVRAQISKAVGF